MTRSRDDQLRAQRYVSFREFKQRRDDGWFARLHDMTRMDRIDRFGSAIPPIYGPLETWETPDQYENKFAAWLRNEHNVRIEVVRRQDPRQERSYRCQFAWDKLFQRDQRSRNKRPHEVLTSDDSKAKKRWKRDERTVSTPPTPRLAAEDAETAEVKREPREESRPSSSGKGSTPGCFVASQQTTTRTSGDPATDTTIVDLTLVAGITRIVLGRCAEAEAADQSLRLRKTTSDPALNDDPIEARLWTLYAAENERVLQRESALEMSSGRLFCGYADTDEMQQLQDDRDRLREELRTSSPKRLTTTAMLVVYLWRSEVDDLRALVQQAASRDSPIIQRASHRKCAALDATLNTKQFEVSKLTQDLNGAMCSDDTSHADAEWMERIANLNDALVAAEEEVRKLHDNRRQELKLLLHFDKRLRLDVEELLKKAAA